MLPIYKDFIKFLKDKECPIKLTEGYFWWDSCIIKCFCNNKIYKVARMWINDDASVKKWTIYKECPSGYLYDNTLFNILHDELECIDSWETTYKNNSAEILAKYNESIEQLQMAKEKYSNCKWVVGNSTGKDSMLTMYLIDKINKDYELIFNNTTMDNSDTYKMAKSINAEIITPKMSNGQNRSFYKMVKSHGTPSRHLRWCCDYFKEGGTQQYYKGQDNLMLVLGTRNEESSKRAAYDFEWKNTQWKNKTWSGLLPIKNWTELELWLFTIHNNIQINPKYKKGYSRVGCAIACPYYTKSTWILDEYWYKEMYNRWHRILEDDFISGEKWYRMNCTKKEYHSNWNGGLVRKHPTQEVLQEFMDYKGIDDIKIAKQYFDKGCYVCNNTKGNPTSINNKDVVAMNLKMLGRNIDKFMCKKCLMKNLNIDKEKWNELVEAFKQQECKLF